MSKYRAKEGNGFALLSFRQVRTQRQPSRIRVAGMLTQEQYYDAGVLTADQVLMWIRIKGAEPEEIYSISIVEAVEDSFDMNTCHIRTDVTPRPPPYNTIYSTPPGQVDTRGNFIGLFELSGADVSLVDPDDAANYLIGSYVIISMPSGSAELLACAKIVRVKSEQKARWYHRTRFERAGAPALQPDQAFSTD